MKAEPVRAAKEWMEHKHASPTSLLLAAGSQEAACLHRVSNCHGNLRAGKKCYMPVLDLVKVCVFYQLYQLFRGEDIQMPKSIYIKSALVLLQH